MTRTNTEISCAHGSQSEPPRNRPGQSEVGYRIGTQPQFLKQMLADVSADPALTRLRTRALSDPSISLIDAWASVLDILSFYQERIANEGWLRTATERRSIQDLARQIGYELNPGVAASTWLSFTIQASPGGGDIYPMPTGLKVQSIPGPDETSQLFETVEDIVGRPEWNAMHPRLSAPQTVARRTTSLWLQGTATDLEIGDLILLVGQTRLDDPESERWDARILTAVDPDDTMDVTRIAWAEDLGHSAPSTDPALAPVVYAFTTIANLFGHNAPDIRAMPEPVLAGFGAAAGATQWPDFAISSPADRLIDLDTVYEDILTGSWIILEEGPKRELYRIQDATTRARADYTLTSKVTRLLLDTDESLAGFALRSTRVYGTSRQLPVAQAPVVDPVHGDTGLLGGLHPDLFVGQTLILRGRILTHFTVAPRGRSFRQGDTIVHDAGTLLTLRPDAGGPDVTLAPDDRLAVFGPPDIDAVGGLIWPVVTADGILGKVLDASGTDLIPLAPEPNDDAFAPPNEALMSSERVVIKQIDRSSGDALLTFEGPLSSVFWRASVSLNGNVALATHGETRLELTSALSGDMFTETLGSGNAARPMQNFRLSQAPLTHVSASTASGGASTLLVRIDGIEWKEVPTLYAQPGDARVYMTRAGIDGHYVVQFGDGRFGARLPTGQGNVTATYRIGLGLASQVRGGQLVLPMTQPLGLQAVTNPLPATGAQDPEAVEDARANAPLTVLTLDRVVSVRDFEDFGRAFAGVGKAQATPIWSGERQIVHLTVVGSDASTLDPVGRVMNNLSDAIDAGRNPERPVFLSPHTERRFGMTLRVAIEPGRTSASVLVPLRARIKARYGFDGQALAQAIEASAVIAHAQGADGVLAVVLSDLDGAPPASQPRLPAQRARWSVADNAILPAELLLLDPERLIIEEMQS